MSWEEYIERLPCPCGNGEYEVLHRKDDWFQHEVYYKMLCPECKKMYEYVKGGVWDKKGMQGDRGWVLKSVLEEEERTRLKNLEHQKEVENRAKKLYFEIWESKFKGLKTKKQIWDVLTVNGKYHPPLPSFYNRVKGFSLEEVENFVNMYFSYSDILRILEICEINNLEWKTLGLNEKEIRLFSEKWASLKE